MYYATAQSLTRCRCHPELKLMHCQSLQRVKANHHKAILSHWKPLSETRIRGLNFARPEPHNGALGLSRQGQYSSGSKIQVDERSASVMIQILAPVMLSV
jgi:hypothetical protein